MTTAALLILTTILTLPMEANTAATWPGQNSFHAPLVRVAKLPDAKIQAFTLDAFIENLKSGTPFIVLSTRAGDPVSIQQEPPLEVLLNESKYADLSVFRLDIDTQAHDAEKLYVDKPGMIMVYRNSKEVSRTSNILDSNKITQLVNEAMHPAQPDITLPE